MFYVLSDDIALSKKLLQEKIDSNFYIKFPGDGRNNRPGNIILNSDIEIRLNLIFCINIVGIGTII